MIDNRYFQVSYPDSMFGDFVIWFINQHDNFFKPRGEFCQPNYQYGKQAYETTHSFPYFNQKYNGNLVREGFPSFQEKTSDNPTIILIDTYYQMRLLGPGVRNPAKKELHDIYYNETMAEKLDDLREELGMPDKIAFKNLWSLSSHKMPDVSNGHMSLPYEGISMIYITIEDLDSVWFDVYDKRCVLNEEDGYITPKILTDFPSSELTLNVDKFLNMETQEYKKLLSYIDEPPLEDWEEYILKYRTHLDVTLGET